MPTLKMELIRGAEFEITEDAARAVRMGKVNGIDLADTPDAEAMVKVWATLKTNGFKMGQPLSTTYPTLLLSRVRVQPIIERQGKDAWVFLEYIREPNQFSPTLYIVRDESYVTQQQSPVIPGTRVPITVSFATGSLNDAGAAITAVASDIVLFNIYRPVRALSVTALRAGRPTGGFQDRVGYVNNLDWPVADVAFPTSMGSGSFVDALEDAGADAGELQPSATAKPKGYWMLHRYATEWSRATGQTLVQAQAVTRVNEDWSEVGTLRNAQGKYPFGEMTAADRTSLISSVNAAAYTHGIIYPTGAPSTHKGIVRIGPYPTTNFFDLFGF